MKMFKSKKAQGISLTTIVIAVIALIVLVILILIFSGKINFFREGVGNCPPESGSAVGSADQCTGLPLKIIKDTDGKVKYCCRAASSCSSGNIKDTLTDCSKGGSEITSGSNQGKFCCNK